jgi:hypothetical protein
MCIVAGQTNEQYSVWCLVVGLVWVIVLCVFMAWLKMQSLFYIWQHCAFVC